MKTVLRSGDLTCPSCAARIERALGAVDGVETARAHFTTGRIEVWHDLGRASVRDLIETMRSLGYEAKTAVVR